MENKSIGKTIVENIGGVFLPIINLITAASIIKSILILLAVSDVLSKEGGIYRIFYAVSDGVFYFLPFLLAFTSAKQFKADPYISLMIPIAFLYPATSDLLENGTSFIFICFDVPPAVYHSSVIPVVLAVLFLHFIEIPFEKILPQAIKGFMKPILCMLIVLPFTFLVFGPIGTWIGQILTKAFFAIYGLNSIVAGAFMGTIIQPLVAIGGHWAIVPVALNNIAEEGYDIIMPLLAGAVYGQAGAAFAVGIKEKNRDKRILAFQSCFTACLGVTEPALYSVNLPKVKPMIFGCAGGFAGGALVGFAGTHCISFAFPSILTSVAFAGHGFGLFLLSMPLGFLTGFILTYLFTKTEETVSA
ncbi:MAG: PTS transporter subunit EIIC [Treponema sp.]|nr:PTS transporter subunit EIIC [Candidatus Treponema equi]